nr:recombinase family protein [Sphingomonas sp. SORGH_AS_0438]
MAKANRSGTRAFAYMRLSVDKEGGAPQSIDAQRSAILAYAAKHDIIIVEEFADAGFSGQTDKRPEFQRLVQKATAADHPVDLVLMFMFSRMARNMRLFFDVVGKLDDAGVEVRSITEDFGQGRGQRIGRTITAMMNEEQARDAAILTRKSRRENARQGFYNGGPVPFGYETYVARQDGEKERRKLAIVEAEAAIVRQIFDWARHRTRRALDRQTVERSGANPARCEVRQQQCCRHFGARGVHRRLSRSYRRRRWDHPGRGRCYRSHLSPDHYPGPVRSRGRHAGNAQSQADGTACRRRHHATHRGRPLRHARLFERHDDPHGERWSLYLLRLQRPGEP